MKTQHNNRFWCYAGLLLVMLVAGTGIGMAQDVTEVPDYLTYVFPAYFPKNGQGDYSTSGMTPGDVRNMMGNYYEGWWREVSYHRANPTNGLSDRGYYMATKTVGEVAMPWAMSPGNVVMGESNVVGRVVGTATADLETEYSGVLSPLPVGGRSIAFQIGTRVVSSGTGYDALGGDGTGSINLATGAYAFKLKLPAPDGTPIEVFYTAYIQGAAPSPANWANFSQVMNDMTAGYRMPDGRGEHFMESAYLNIPAVLYQRFDPAANALVDDPLVDGFWTPGERFTDQPRGGGTQPPTGYWNPYVHDENRWTPAITNWGIADQYPNILPFGMRNFMVDTPQRRRGDFFLDYNFSILAVDEDGRVLPPAAGFSSLLDLNVEIRVADRDRLVNVSTNISEFNLTPPRYFRSRVDVVSTNITEDGWMAEGKSASPGTTGALILEPELPLLLADPRVGGVIADYTLNINANTNNVNASNHSRVTTIANLAHTNSLTAPFYVADFSTGTNRPLALSSLDLTPPQFYTNFATGVTGPAEDRWIPQLNFTGIAANLEHLAGIRAYFNTLNADGERYRGDALLDYGFNYRPASGSWGANPALVGTRSVNIYVADISLGANVPVLAVNEMDLTPPLMYSAATPIYGLAFGAPQTTDPGGELEGDASHTYVPGLPGLYADIPNLGRFEVDFDTGGNPLMQDSGTNVSIYVYLDNTLYATAVASPGVPIRYPNPIISANSFLYDGSKIQILSAGSDFWSECVETGVLGYPAADYAELRIPLYHAEPLFGAPDNVGGVNDYLNPAPGATVANPFSDAVGGDDVWTPGAPGGFTAAVPYYGTDGANAITNDSVPTLEGDSPYDNVSTPPQYADIPAMGRFEYQVSTVDGRPLVYLAESYVEVQVLLPSNTVNQLLHPTNPRVNGAIYDSTLGRIMVTNAPGNTAHTRAFATFMHSQAAGVTSNSLSLQYPAHVRVPVFYAEGLVNSNGNYRNLWGAPASTNYLDAPVAPGVIDSRFTDATPAIYGGPDNQWTPYFTVSVTSPPIFSVSFDANGTIQTNNNPLLGDAQWTYVRDNTADPPNLNPIFENIGTLNRIEYNIEVTNSRPHIYKSDFHVIVETWVDLPQSLLDALEGDEGTVIQGFSMIQGVLHVPEPSEQFFSSDFVAGNTPNPDPDRRRRAHVHVPLYYSARIWGEPLNDDDTLNPFYTNHFSVAAVVDNEFIDAIPQQSDEQWTERIEADPMTDFIPIWDPVLYGDAGGWVAGLVGTPNSGVLPRGSTPTVEYWSWDQYTSYIANNYPGDVAGLIARADNNLYDGPERWAEVDNNQMMQSGYLGGFDPSPDIVFGSWDFSVGPAHINSYEDWWLDRYGRYGSTSAEFSGSVPNVFEWKPELTDFNQVQGMTTNITTNAMGEVSSAIIYSAMTHPPMGTTWTYDAPREFDDLPSSLHVNPELGALSGLINRGWFPDRYIFRHNPDAAWDGGDFRLGEVTSPWNNSIWGHDRGYDDPDRRNLDPDEILRMSGPYAYNVYANFGYDAANQLNLEFVTHRTDGQNLTGPRGGHAKVPGYNYMALAAADTLEHYSQAIMYARDHRDVNLTGMIDQGETIPANSHNYMVDPQGDTTNDGRSSNPIFGWARIIEHLVSIYDAVEDYSEVGRYTVPGRSGASDLGIMQPSGFRWLDGMAATALLSDLYPGADIVYADTDGSGDYTPNVDALWIDGNGDGVFDGIETLIYNPNGALGLQEEADGAGAFTAQWADLDGDLAFDSNWDLAWLDTDTRPTSSVGVFDSEPVLADSRGLLQPGVAGQEERTWSPALGINRSIYVYPDMTNFSLMWAVTNTYNGTNEVYLGSTNGVDLIYQNPGFTPAWGATTGVLWTGARVWFVSANPSSVVYLNGDSVFIDESGNENYDGDTVVSRLLMGLRPDYDGLLANETFAIGYTTNAIGNFDRNTSAVWLETTAPANRRNGETLVSGPTALPTGTASDGDLSANIQWIDMPIGTNAPNGVFDPVQLSDGSDLSYSVLGDVYLGDALFYDRDANTLFDIGATVQRGVYIAPLYNQVGIADPGAFVAGHIHGLMTREGYMTDFSQVEPITAQPGLLTHEQGHDLLGYPDLYDYDVSDPEVNNEPVNTADLMAGLGLIHGYPDLKFRSNVPGGGESWPALNAVDPVELNYGAGALLTSDGQVVTLQLYPVERHPDQYYVFRKEGSPQEFFTLCYNAGPEASPYANNIGRGLMITKSDYETSESGQPMQQRSNSRYTHLVVQADAAYALEDGAEGIGPEDAFGNTPETRVFTAHTRPPAIWWDQSGSGLRVLDIRVPEDPFGPAEVDLQWIPIATPPIGSFPVHYYAPTGYDSDGDGIPDAWEYYWFGRYPDPLAIAGANTDYDLDGLNDYYEWLAGSDPTVRSSWTEPSVNPNDLSDADLDIDGDGLSNIEEQRRGTHPRLPDTADNGLLDGDETDVAPGISLVPLVDRVLQLDGALTSFVQMPRQLRFSLPEFTLQAWVNPTANDGDIIARQVQEGVYNYRLGLTNGFVALSFTAGNFNPTNLTPADVVVLTNTVALPLNAWTHVAGMFNAGTGKLSIYTNGAEAASMYTVRRPAVNGVGPVWTRVGMGFNGMLDEVTIFNRALQEIELATFLDGVVASIVPGMVSCYRFDDGTRAVWDGLAGGQHTNTSGRADWYWGQVEDFAGAFGEQNYEADWLNDWRNAGTLVGAASMAIAPVDAPLRDIYLDSDGDGLPDWWEIRFLGPLYPDAHLDPRGDTGTYGNPTGDGIINWIHYMRGTDPLQLPQSMELSWEEPDTWPFAEDLVIDVQVGDAIPLTLTRDAGEAAGTVTLATSDSSLFVLEPAEIAFAAGQTNATVQLRAVGMAAGFGVYNGQLRVYADNVEAVARTVQVYPGANLQVLQPVDSTNQVVMGDTATFRVFRTRHAVGLLSMPMTVSLSVSDSSYISIPETVTIPGGSDVGYFSVAGLRVTTNAVFISAEAVGFPTHDLRVDVTPPNISMHIYGVATNRIDVHTGSDVAVQFVRPSTQTGGELRFTPISSDDSLFTVTTNDVVMPAGVAAAWVTVYGAYNAQGYSGASGSLTLDWGYQPAAYPVTVHQGLSLSASLGGDLYEGDTRTMTITRGADPGVQGGLDRPLTVFLGASASLGVPESVIIPAGHASVDVTVTGIARSADGVIGVSAPGYPGTSLAVPVLPVDVRIGRVPGVSDASVTVGPDETITLWVTRPSDRVGADLAMTAESPGLGIEPVDLLIPAGLDRISLQVTGLQGGINQLVIRSALGTTLAAMDVVVSATLAISGSDIAVGHVASFAVDLNISETFLSDSTGTVIRLSTISSSAANSIAYPDTVTVPAGSRSASFEVAGLRQRNGIELVAEAADEALGLEPVSFVFNVTNPNLSFEGAPYAVEVDSPYRLQMLRPETEAGGSLAVTLRSGSNNVFRVSASAYFDTGSTSALFRVTGGDVAFVGQSAALTALVNAYSVSTTVDLVPKTFRLYRVEWDDVDKDEEYSEGDVVRLLFNEPLDPATFADVTQGRLVLDDGILPPTIHPAGSWGVGAVASVSNDMALITLGAYPVLVDDDDAYLAVSPATDVTTDIGVPINANAYPIVLPWYSLTSDADDDGLPDWWEDENALDPFDPTGINGAHGDPDLDGLSNYQEFLANTDPRNSDTLNTGFSDYDSRPSAFEPTFGQTFDDGDRIADAWEVLYMYKTPGTLNRSLDPRYYDAHLDPDEDGWSNYAEFMAGTDPTSVLDYPRPMLQFNARYGGRYGDTLDDVLSEREYTENVDVAPASPPAFVYNLQSGQVTPLSFTLRFNIGSTSHVVSDSIGGDLIGSGIINGSINHETGSIEVNFAGDATDLEMRYLAASDLNIRISFYDKPSMDGFPVARLDINAAFENTAIMSSRYLVEGPLWLFAYLDINSDGEWDPVEEPAGISSFTMGWGDWNEVEIPLTDDRQMRGFPRIIWDPVGEEYEPVVTGYSIIANQGRVELFHRFVESPRNYLHEGDFLYENLNGVGPSDEPFVFLIYRNESVFGLDYNNFHVEIVRFVTNQVQSTPVFITGHDTTFAYARNILDWTMDGNATWYQLEFRADLNDAPGTDTLMLTGRLTAPFRNKDGQYRADLPFYAGDVRPDGGVWSNGRYWMRMTTGMQQGATRSSDWRAFNLNLREPQLNGGTSMVEGKLYYFGGHDFFSTMLRRAGAVSNNMPVIVQSFMNPGFSGVPDAQFTIDPSVWTNTQYRLEAPFRLKGLHRGVHYLRAFVDANRNGKLDYWETWGFGRDLQTYYEPVSLELEGEAVRITDQMMIIRDRDTDGDDLPDIWEYHNYGGGATDDSFLNLYGEGSDGSNDLELASRWQYGLDAFSDVEFVDQNNNAIPDEWEMYYFGRLLDAGDEQDDFDGDGMSILSEFRAGTDPTNPKESLRVTGTLISGGSPSLSWSAPQALNYRVEYTDTLTGIWVMDNNLANYTWTAIGGGAYDWTYADPAPPANGSRFYRVVIVTGAPGDPVP